MHYKKKNVSALPILPESISNWPLEPYQGPVSVLILYYVLIYGYFKAA